MFTHILVPTDGSAFSEAAVNLAATLAADSGAKLTGLHVIPEFHVITYSPEMLTDTEEQFHRIARQHAVRPPVHAQASAEPAPGVLI